MRPQLQYDDLLDEYFDTPKKISCLNIHKNFKFHPHLTTKVSKLS